MRLLSVEEIVGGNAPWKTCSIHGPANPNVWGCPECLRDLRKENAHLKICVPQSAAALPRNLKRLMAERRWNVVSLAIASGVSGSTIRGILTGTPPTSVADPLLSTCLKLAQALEVYLDQLVEEREP
jgi:DNA-binding Xre family transcriptional regulator